MWSSQKARPQRVYIGEIGERQLTNKRLVNIGCGNRTHLDWVNLDLVSHLPDVIQHDLQTGLPFPDQTCDAVYHSHVLEHLSQEEGRKLITECWRVLKPGGILRVVVPDLENIARAYVNAIDDSERPNEEMQANLRWMRIELFDQMVRCHTGGEMQQFAREPGLKNRAFVESRVGDELFQTRQHVKRNKRQRRPIISMRRLRKRAKKMRHGLLLVAATLIAGRAGYRAFKEGLFRQSGEIHQWMYDRISLHELLEVVGFDQINVCLPNESGIASFVNFELDTTGGRVRKPDSLFMEAVKPPSAVHASDTELAPQAA